MPQADSGPAPPNPFPQHGMLAEGLIDPADLANPFAESERQDTQGTPSPPSSDRSRPGTAQGPGIASDSERLSPCRGEGEATGANGAIVSWKRYKSGDELRNTRKVSRTSRAQPDQRLRRGTGDSQDGGRTCGSAQAVADYTAVAALVSRRKIGQHQRRTCCRDYISAVELPLERERRIARRERGKCGRAACGVRSRPRLNGKMRHPVAHECQVVIASGLAIRFVTGTWTTLVKNTGTKLVTAIATRFVATGSLAM